jgi:hypothetical protein
VVIAFSPSVPAAATPPNPHPVSPFAASSLKGVEHVDHICECGDIDYPERTGTLANPDLADSSAN